MTKLITLYLVNNSIYEILTIQIIGVVSVSCLDSDSVDLGWGLKFCISDNLQGNANCRPMDYSFNSK